MIKFEKLNTRDMSAVKWKRHEYLQEAFSAIQAQYPDIKWEIYVDGGGKQFIQPDGLKEGLMLNETTEISFLFWGEDGFVCASGFENDNYGFAFTYKVTLS